VLKRRRPKIELKHFHLTHQLILRKTKSRSYSRYLGFAKNYKDTLKIDTYRLSKWLSMNHLIAQIDNIADFVISFSVDAKLGWNNVLISKKSP
jgi:hypothetical protein